MRVSDVRHMSRLVGELDLISKTKEKFQLSNEHILEVMEKMPSERLKQLITYWEVEVRKELNLLGVRD